MMVMTATPSGPTSIVVLPFELLIFFPSACSIFEFFSENKKMIVDVL